MVNIFSVFSYSLLCNLLLLLTCKYSFPFLYFFANQGYLTIRCLFMYTTSMLLIIGYTSRVADTGSFFK